MVTELGIFFSRLPPDLLQIKHGLLVLLLLDKFQILIISIQMEVPNYRDKTMEILPRVLLMLNSNNHNHSNIQSQQSPLGYQWIDVTNLLSVKTSCGNGATKLNIIWSRELTLDSVLSIIYRLISCIRYQWGEVIILAILFP